jgi:hypothetical protein
VSAGPASQTAPAVPSSRRPGAPVAQKALDALTALRTDYALALPGRVRSLAQALRAWRRAPGSEAHMERARELAHRLRGTAGSYGFPAVGLAAGRVEDAVLRTAGDPGEAHTSAWGELWSALRDAEALAAEAIHKLPRKDGAR